MYPNQDHSLYQQDDIAIQAAAATPHQLVLMLFAGLMDELVRAKSHIVAKRYEKKAKSINKCIDILNGLTAVLNYEKGGEVAANLARLYDYCVFRLYGASHQLSTELVEEAEKILISLHEGWIRLGSKSKKNG
ncbi:flagellar export chaperone FliS [Candidatus Fukatsuia symbiotica]|uniref:Flagellar secretion chaperone FliS n=1 Tax=Candidatus Fukatsuia symbiotica TaxID=1878942 RepID=A0A2U8I663_9GAMM|nr:flagellar export chaperone FliS [Candidatus Fukatsuia symbiotica]AWK14632.1 flagellar protein FliS [Candidatus Fukatsuia symbiotica]MEA9444946.1 flagellar export chaperone FliS [Candidatus Fukatsuia symbiotica]